MVIVLVNARRRLDDNPITMQGHEFLKPVHEKISYKGLLLVPLDIAAFFRFISARLINAREHRSHNIGPPNTRSIGNLFHL